MTWRRAEVAVWGVSGIALVVALVLLIQDRQDRLVMLFIVISLGVRLLFDLARRLARSAGADGARRVPHDERPQ
jgi:steroid 5-alpha reductase family enzyme